MIDLCDDVFCPEPTEIIPSNISIVRNRLRADMFVPVEIIYGLFLGPYPAAHQQRISQLRIPRPARNCSSGLINILYNYELMEYPAFQWIETEVNGTDMKTAVRTGLDKLMKYAHFSNAADTIIPVSAPLGLTGFLVNGTLQQKFKISLIVPVQVVSPPEPTDQTVKIGTSPGAWCYVRVLDTKVYGQHYYELVMEFLNDLEQDKQSFEKRFFVISWFNTDGLMDIAFQRNEE
ncbi:uncharacterized protein [Heptranchias perlo]|uniref:uncharacterized protein n=1 Tax=Heptranchias perlo TaxID=212740 RepID=UPI003559C84C